MSELRNFAEGEFYHIYNRGNNKQDIFFCEDDYDRFAKLLFLCNSDKKINFREDIIEKDIDAYDFERGEPLVSIGAWALMPNHFHLYLTSQRSDLWESGQISAFAKKLCVAYSMYVNKKYSRTGSLFEGRFKSIRINEENHAKYLFSYIHLNPVKIIDPMWKIRGLTNREKTLDFLNKYKWSSYNEYNGNDRKESIIISPEKFPDYFSDKRIFEREIFEWLNFPKV